MTKTVYKIKYLIGTLLCLHTVSEGESVTILMRNMEQAGFVLEQ